VSWLGALAGRAWRALPPRVRRRLLSGAVRCEAEDDPADALRSLFALEDRLSLAIGAAAMRYGDGLHPKHRLTDLHAFLVDRIADGERVLDVGCGLGAIAHAIASARDARVVAIDEDPRSIEIARARHAHPRLEFRCADARRELPDPPFDTVVMSHVLEHLEHRRAFLQMLPARLGARRLLVLLPLFDRSWTVPLRRELGVRWKSDDGHFAEETRDGWLRELEQAGLTVRHAEVRWGELWCEAEWRQGA
jgi:SAM-dependent methyltransferase